MTTIYSFDKVKMTAHHQKCIHTNQHNFGTSFDIPSFKTYKTSVDTWYHGKTKHNW